MLHGTPSLVKVGVARILQTEHNASDRPGSFSNERLQSHMVLDASHLDVKTQSLSLLRKHAWQGRYMSTRVWHLGHSIGWRKCIRFWDQDHSAGWRKYIRIWDLKHSAGCSKQLKEFHVSCQRRIIGLEWHDFVSNEQRGSEKKNSTRLTKWHNSEASCFSLSFLQIARLGR